VGDLAVSLPSYFGLSGVRAVKERGYYLLNSAKIYKSSSNPQEINARYNLLRQLEQAGFPFTDAIIPAAGNTPFVSLGREIYVMTRHIAGHEPDLDNLRDMTMVFENLARFHAAARGFKNAPAVSVPLTKVYSKQTASLCSVIKQVNRRPRLSDFDVLILKHTDSYTERANNALEILGTTDYADLYADALANNHICHNSLKEETFSICEENCYISRFDDASVDLQLADIASVLRRYARKSLREIPIRRFLEIYDKILSLPSSAEKIIYAQLLFPWPFIKNVSQYYSKKRNFIPVSINTRMTNVLEEQEKYDEYINVLT
jgi:CotS family spore coat protein